MSPSDAAADVVVIGAGVMGASIAYHLTARGAKVALVDAGLPGRGATQHSFGWIGRSADSVDPAAELHELARADWRRLEDEVPGLDVHWSGAVTWGEFFAHDRAPRVRDVAGLEPRYVDPPSEAQLSADDGWVDPVKVTEGLVAAAQAAGASVHCGRPVRRVVLRDGAAAGVELDGRRIEAPTVVIAAGTGSSALCASVGVPLEMQAAPAVMVKLQAPPGLVRHIVGNDLFEARQDEAGVVLMPLDHHGERTERDLADTAEWARRIFQRSFGGTADVRVISSGVGWRPMPVGGLPVVGRSSTPGVHVAVAHPGMTLASSLGRLVSEEIATGMPSAVLEPFRPTSSPH